MKTNNEKLVKRQLKTNIETIETLERYQKEGRGDWWFYPLWKQILYVIIFPFVMLWIGLTWVIMIIGRGLFQLGDLMSGKRWNGGNWLEDV